MRVEVGDVVMLDVVEARKVLGAAVANDELQPGDVVLVQRHPDLREIICAGHVVIRKAWRAEVADMLRPGLGTPLKSAMCDCVHPLPVIIGGRSCSRCLRPLA